MTGAREFSGFVVGNGMLLELMLSEVEAQIQRAALAADRLDKVLGANWEDLPASQIWADLYALAEAAANVSRILRPAIHSKRSATAKDFSGQRGDVLRALLQISDEHPILARNLRNRLTHLDEDIDDWWLESERHNIVRRSIANTDSPGVALDAREIFEHFNIRSRDFFYRGERYSTIALWRAIEDVQSKLLPARLQMRTLLEEAKSH